MLILFTSFVVLLAVIFAVLVKRRSSSNRLEETPRTFIPAETLRPLFAPDDEELLRLEREKTAEEHANQSKESRRVLEEKRDKIPKLQIVWQESPDRRKTVELLYLAAQSESGRIYAETAENISRVWQAGKLDDFPANDLIEMLETHFWLLPVEERTSGVRFTLNQLIAGLRRKS